MRTISVAVFPGLILMSGAALSGNYDFDVYAYDFDEAERAAISQCVANNAGSTRLRCGSVTCGNLPDGRTGCYIPQPMSDEDVEALKAQGYRDDGTYE